MDCERCLEQLDAYLDGELDAPDASLLSAHLRQCPNCQAEYRAREWENRLYRDMAAGVSLPEGLWPRIAAGLAAVDEREQRRSGGGRTNWFRPELSGWWRLGLALGCLLVLAVGLWFWLRPAVPAEPLLAQGPTPPSLSDTGDLPRTLPPAGTPSAGSETLAPADTVIIEPPRRRTGMTSPPPVRERPPSEAEQILSQVEQTYLVVIERLQSQARLRRMKLDPATRTAIDQTLAGLDAQIAQTREVVCQSSTDPAALHFLLTAYRKKAELLSEIIVMTEGGGS
ncbi:anti-sigma factor [Chloracidobacterium aggregatum]|uniref:Zf-HC2 domain-containing protein n=2 Tax=Chloracidobacterium TaxID=458032 RepID=A0ABX8B350_9BACT|nr:zf-HC2 domain-containing protein [Chloracidobacterium aggregatum]QUV86528.1 zf-HC2 domain-containing protein [Chloracidobacterium sp. 2]QUV89040.1 zf-HC2 domain-containing protein [Chloracidobacterium sp. S]QUV95425.1 zf-HC2 domain-containing protein [Chloracidobacterium sp. N]QUV98649.1 zf-HC2 domain-containing protein [Chloracidobacterium sp. E]